METASDGSFSDLAQPRSAFPVPEGRTEGAELEREIQAVNQSEIVKELLSAMHGVVAVLNEHRQVLAINKAVFEELGISDPSTILGLRLGEAVRCIHAQGAPGGCGTSEHCPTCGAAIVQVAALAGQRSADQLCAIEIPGRDANDNLFFRVCASPLTISGHKLILLFLRDVSAEQRAAALEQIFLHDLRNTSQGLTMGSSLLVQECTGESQEVARQVLHLASRLSREIEIHRCLADSDVRTIRSHPTEVSVAAMMDELRMSSRYHPAQVGRELEIIRPTIDFSIASDPTILHRVLYNMVINALEATPAGGKVRLTVARYEQKVVFAVWNAAVIPTEVALRIFQRNFSTKTSLGHGLGTYSMKLLGEKILQGYVSFTSTEEEGTTFTFTLPLRQVSMGQG
jgi:K+-sensing histidine kinase KdpD